MHVVASASRAQLRGLHVQMRMQAGLSSMHVHACYGMHSKRAAAGQPPSTAVIVLQQLRCLPYLQLTDWPCCCCCDTFICLQDNGFEEGDDVSRAEFEVRGRTAVLLLSPVHNNLRRGSCTLLWFWQLTTK
jgi:hypothetical protein